MKKYSKIKTPIVFTLLFFAFFWKGAGGEILAQDGTLDLSFNPTDVGYNSGIGAIYDVRGTAVQSDGKIIIWGGIVSYNGTPVNRLARLNTDGTLDISFNQGTGVNGSIGVAVIQNDGKIIIGGIFSSYNGTPINRLARLNQDGTLDTSFDPGTGTNGGIGVAVIQNDGKIIIGGEFTTYNGISRTRIARINQDGSLDTNFDPGTGLNNFIRTISLQSDGKIIIGGGFTLYNGILRTRIARINVDGSLDISFAPGTGANGSVQTSSIQTDGKIIIGGFFDSYNGTVIPRIARINTNGTLDTSFDPDSGPDVSISTTSIQNDGKIIIAHWFSSYNNTPINSIARLNENGTLDESFNPGLGVDYSIYSAVIQSDGKIIIAGDFSSYNGITQNGITRLNVDGSRDINFNPNSGANSTIKTTSIQSNGKIITGGAFTSYNNTTINHITRLNTDGTMDFDFNIGSGPNATVETTSIQSDGKIIIGGSFTSYNGTPISRIARLNVDGSLDTDFNPGLGANNTVNSISIQSDGKIIIGGSFTSFSGTTQYRIARLNSDGTLDTSFNIGTGANNIVYSSSIQVDGKIIISGSFTSFNNTIRNNIVRLNIDGTIDMEFDTEIGANNTIHSISIQNDGKIIIGGFFTSYNNITRNNIARLNLDGTLDTEFDSESGTNDIVQSISIQQNGKIVISGGFTTYNEISRNYIAQLNADGTLDTEFDPETGANGWVHTTSIQENGKIIFGGNFTAYNGIGRNRIGRLQGACINSTGTDFITACYSYTWMDGITYTSSNNTATHILTNAIGCDSIITLNLLINTSGTDVITACDEYTWIDGITYTSSNNTATYTLINSNGCDSTVTLNLTISNLTSGIDIITTCNEYTWIDGTTYNSSNNTAIHTLTNSAGCDSIVTLNLTINNLISGIDVITTCDEYTWIDGITYNSSNNTAIHTLINSAGCDSIVTLNLTINNVDTTIIVNDLTITSNAIGANYQWLDCNNANNPISGETGWNYTATANGSYAVEVTQYGCTEISACVDITTVGLNEPNENKFIILFPNPTKENIHLNIHPELIGQTITLVNTFGQELNRVVIDNTTLMFNLSEYANGIYLIRTTSQYGTIIRKVVKQ